MPLLVGLLTASLAVFMVLGIPAMALLGTDAMAQTKGLERVPAEEQARFSREDKVAVVVGVGSYPQVSGLRPLAYAAADAHALTEVLRTAGYLVKPLVDAEATRSGIRKTLRSLGRVLSPGKGTVVFAFSGHGFAKGGRNFLATVESADTDIERSGLALAEVESLLRETGARRRVMLVDACRNNPSMGKSLGSGGVFGRYRESKGLQVLYSTEFGELSHEAGILGHGVFTHFVLEGLRGEAANGQGLVTFAGLSDYVQREVKRWTFEHLNAVQLPFAAGEWHGDFLLARSEARRPARPSPAPVSGDALGAGMVRIDPGCFQMGSPPSEKGRFDNERQHRVCIDKAFGMGRHEVTFAEYDRFARATGRNLPKDRGWGRGNRPVINVSWHDAAEYAEWLSRQTGKRYRLPTEAEWEYAARAGTRTAYWWGHAVGRGNANCDGCGSRWDNEQTAPVGSFPSNPWGLYDTAGNVWEWTCSTYAKDHDGSENHCASKGAGGSRAVRGGSLLNLPRWVRSALRFRLAPTFRFDTLGFRLAQDL